MNKVRHFFPGGNTCYGFHSFYDHIVSSEAKMKIILKGGPGVGKSSLMKYLGEKFHRLNIDIEYHWCSSDPDSLDALCLTGKDICVLDGTSPHVVDPRFPGAVDEIVNLGEFLDLEKLRKYQKSIIHLHNVIADYFKLAYLRLQESNFVLKEWQSYYNNTVDKMTQNRNILNFCEMLELKPQANRPKLRHLFASAITPNGIVHHCYSLLDKSYSLYAVKGSPGSSYKLLFYYLLNYIKVNNIYAEVFHNPFDPNEVDIILIPEKNIAVIDLSSYIVDYKTSLNGVHYKQFLDFDQFIIKTNVSPHKNNIKQAKERFDNGLQSAINLIEQAKIKHDELESYYISAMDFDRVSEVREALFTKILAGLDS